MLTRTHATDVSAYVHFHSVSRIPRTQTLPIFDHHSSSARNTRFLPIRIPFILGYNHHSHTDFDSGLCECMGEKQYHDSRSHINALLPTQTMATKRNSRAYVAEIDHDDDDTPQRRMSSAYISRRSSWNSLKDDSTQAIEDMEVDQRSGTVSWDPQAVSSRSQSMTSNSKEAPLISMSGNRTSDKTCKCIRTSLRCAKGGEGG